ncbi:cold-shock protein [Streptomyces sp. NPDC059070]|uniref:cold-shock protein n=1 Tax=unclassified Streptomyces TaxID=2593676 RepID=UPI0034E1F7F9
MSEVRFAGTVREWHAEEGWGVVTSADLSEPVWAHFSHIEAGGFRELVAGEAVVFTAERAEQDGHNWRAVRVWRDPGAKKAK